VANFLAEKKLRADCTTFPCNRSRQTWPARDFGQGTADSAYRPCIRRLAGAAINPLFDGRLRPSRTVRADDGIARASGCAWRLPPVSNISSNLSESAMTEPRIGRSVSIDQAATVLRVSRRTVYNRIRDGRLQTIRTLGGSQRVLVESLHEMGLRPQPFPSSASASVLQFRPVART
jgi:excisionase family DNA binding protein